jgi:hypothetical protein
MDQEILNKYKDRKTCKRIYIIATLTKIVHIANTLEQAQKYYNALGDDCKYFAIVPPVLVIDQESDEEDENTDLLKKPGLKRETSTYSFVGKEFYI